MTWLVLACYIGASYFAIAALVAVLARLAGLPIWIAVLAGIAWGPVMAWVLIDAWRKSK